MREIGCLMTDPMQRANLSGDKDVTRRIGKTWARAKVGDRLWFREVWAYAGAVSVIPMPRERIIYRCDYPSCVHPSLENIPAKEDVRWSSSMIMPRSVCRATGIITDIRQVPLHSINTADAIREGMETVKYSDILALRGKSPIQELRDVSQLWDRLNPVERFICLFDILNPSQWQLNSLVWRVEWRRE